MRKIGLLTGTLVLLITSGASAQTPAAKRSNLQERLRPPAPTSVQAVPQLTVEEKAALNPAKTPAEPGRIGGRSVALMLAGGVLFVLGAIIGDDAGTALMVGGAIVGVYGVYLYFR